MDATMIGIIGSLIILFSWAYETIECVKKHKSLIDLKFAVLSLVGTAILVFYAYIEHIFVFLFLDVCLIIIILFEIVYTVHVQKIRKRFRKFRKKLRKK